MTIKNESSKDWYLQCAIKSGLSSKAAAVYVSLLEGGTSLSPKAIIRRTALHRQYVYDALGELRDRHLVIKIGTLRSSKYRATSPDRLLQEAEKQRLDALDGVAQLMRLYDRSPSGMVEIIHGSQKVIEEELQILRDAREGDFFGYSGWGRQSLGKTFSRTH